jgi:hypothetical protein
LALFAAGLALGASTSVTTGDAEAVAWIALSGLGLGLVLPTTIDTALGAVSDESSGVSSGVLQALRMVGGALGPRFSARSSTPRIARRSTMPSRPRSPEPLATVQRQASMPRTPPTQQLSSKQSAMPS